MSRPIFIFVICITAIRVVAASLLPIIQDEAYYLVWSRHLDFGYFDHPPMVAWISALGGWLNSVWAQRFGTIIVSILVIPWQISLLDSLYGHKNADTKSAILIGFVLLNANLFAIVNGFLTTPDVVFFSAWCVALAEASRALKGEQKRWLAAGVATGIGLLSKYLMLLIGPVFLWGLFSTNRQQLKTPWPYLGGVLALLVFSPNLFWNARHDWVSFRFQLNHGLSDSHQVSLNTSNQTLPPASKAEVGSREFQLGEYFVDPLEKKKPKKPPTPEWRRLIRRLSELASTQIGLWGAFLAVGIMAWRRRDEERPITPPNPQTQKFLWGAAFIPLAFFLCLALFSKVEANWPAVYTIAFAALASRYFLGVRRPLFIAGMANLVLVLALTLHSINPFLPVRADKDRILRETQGYDRLSHFLEGFHEPIFFDTYQTGAMLRYHAPTLRTSQWPGITRHSEFLIRGSLKAVGPKEIYENRGFWLVGSNRIPPVIEGFYASNLLQYTHCLGQAPVLLENTNTPYKPACAKTKVRRWYLTRYTTP